MNNKTMLLSFLYLLIMFQESVAADATWNYSTLYGFEESFYIRGKEISLKSADVTIRDVGCSVVDSALCIDTLRLTLMIPVLNKIKQSWGFDDATFSLESKQDKIQIFGQVFENVLFIRSKKKIYTDLDRKSMSHIFHEFIFSYEDGLLAYRETNQAYASGYFLFSKQPCGIGGKCFQ